MEQKIKFQKLTPTSAVDLSVYEDAFEYVFDNDDIRNIAISGPYSAGKSSLLESYKKSHKDKTFLHISLAHFKEPNNDEDTDVSSIFESNRRPKVQINAMNKKVLDALKECGHIASFLEDKENNVYKQFRRSSTA